MRKILLASALLAGFAGLSGCAAIQAIQAGSNFVVTQNELDAAKSGYAGAFLTPAAHYRNLGFCKTGTVATLALPCADRAIVAKLDAANKAVVAQFAAVQAMIAAGDNSGVAAAFTTLQGLIATAESILAQNGVS